ncbi:uncharacterized protein M6B38_106870 [Iris pallida]|uniref:Uncharacterized protein n=1 Tax=Iris pallida TaxID=29817 RepID=A0AAX6ETF1_IRIPA|nr:uncharacterized protein M6B38_106870 [Iris pallida]
MSLSIPPSTTLPPHSWRQPRPPTKPTPATQPTLPRLDQIVTGIVTTITIFMSSTITTPTVSEPVCPCQIHFITQIYKLNCKSHLADHHRRPSPMSFPTPPYIDAAVAAVTPSCHRLHKHHHPKSKRNPYLAIGLAILVLERGSHIP